MVRKPKDPPNAFTSDEIFHYHLTELELTVESGKIRWTADTVIAARRRLDRLTDKMNEVVVQPVKRQ